MSLAGSNGILGIRLCMMAPAEALIRPMTWASRAGLGDEVDAGDARRAALVLDQHRLAEPRRHALGEIAAEDVGRPAGRKRHDQGERLAGKGGLGVSPGKGQGRQSADGHATRNAQFFLPFVAPTVRKDRRGGKTVFRTASVPLGS